MAAYSTLTDQEKEDYEAYELRMRGIVAGLGRVFSDADMTAFSNFYTDRIVPIKAQLDPNESGPKNTGLAGATTLTHEQVTSISTFLNGIETDLQTNLDLLQKAVGINAG